MKMLAIIAVAGLLLISDWISPARGAENLAGRRPNILVLLCDDLGYGDLSCQGHPAIRTPRLDQMARDGVRLTACYSAAPVCSSSRAGLMTGRTPARTGVYDWIPSNHTMHLPRAEKTIATQLKAAGYATCHVGKWHLNGFFNHPRHPQPGDHGFDHWMSTQNNAAPTHKNPKNFVRNGQAIGVQEGYSCQIVATEAIQWIDQHAASDQPFFQYVCFHEPHEKVESPPDLVATYLDDEGPQARNEDEAQYFANVTNVDRAVGRILDALNTHGLDESTLVIFTSDNGPETLDRYPNATRSYGVTGELRERKLWLYDGGIRVPGIARWPGVIPAGVESERPVCSLDFLPTFCELAGAPLPENRPLDGTSLVPLFEDQPLVRERPLYWSYVNAIGKPVAAMRIGKTMILGARIMDQSKNRTGRNINPQSMKEVKTEQLGDFELYDLSQDIKQQNNLADDNPEQTAKLAEQLVARHREVQAEGPTWAFGE